MCGQVANIDSALEPRVPVIDRVGLDVVAADLAGSTGVAQVVGEILPVHKDVHIAVVVLSAFVHSVGVAR